MPIKHQGKSPEQQLTEAQRFVKRLPDLIAREAVNFVKDRFRFGGWVDTSFKRWPPRKTNKGRPRALLIQTGRLRNSVHASLITDRSITITASMPYASAHNEGFSGQVSQNVKAHRRKVKSRNTYEKLKANGKTKRIRQSSGVTFVKAFTRVVNMNIPQRQFMGDSPFFMRRLDAIFTNRIRQLGL